MYLVVNRQTGTINTFSTKRGQVPARVYNVDAEQSRKRIPRRSSGGWKIILVTLIHRLEVCQQEEPVKMQRL